MTIWYSEYQIACPYGVRSCKRVESTDIKLLISPVVRRLKAAAESTKDLLKTAVTAADRRRMPTR